MREPLASTASERVGRRLLLILLSILRSLLIGVALQQRRLRERCAVLCLGILLGFWLAVAHRNLSPANTPNSSRSSVAITIDRPREAFRKSGWHATVNLPRRLLSASPPRHDTTCPAPRNPLNANLEPLRGWLADNNGILRPSVAAGAP